MGADRRPEICACTLLCAAAEVGRQKRTGAACRSVDSRELTPSAINFGGEGNGCSKARSNPSFRRPHGRRRRSFTGGRAGGVVRANRRQTDGGQRACRSADEFSVGRWSRRK